MATRRPLKAYWDSCAWIGFLNAEKDKVTLLRAIWEKAERGEYEIWTSAYVYLEVIYGVSEHGDPYPPAENDDRIEKMLSQDWIRRVQLDIHVGRRARELKRRFHKDGLKKRADAIHLASAIFYDCQELHTFDGSDLLHLDGKVASKDGRIIKIRKPGPEDVPQTLFSIDVGNAKKENDDI
jgi:predicted nucleic acid-binding protein